MIEGSNLKDDAMVSLENQNVHNLHVMRFKTKVINFISSEIPRYDYQFQNTHKDNHSVPSQKNWKVSTYVPLKNVFSGH